MGFKIEECVIEDVWCGKSSRPRKVKNLNSDIPPKRYTRDGTRYECLKKGIGAGAITEAKKHLPTDSLQHIMYIGKTYDERFQEKGIKTRKQLVKKLKSKSPESISKFLKEILTRKGGGVDTRAYNTVLVFLHRNGMKSNLPKCVQA